MSGESIGMMEGAFFVSRGEIINWINEILKIRIQKVEQLGTGAIYCQLFDCIYPGQINLSKVNWKAKNDYEYIANLKLLQNSFIKQQINKVIEIEKLAKAKYQDNLEFVQWFKKFFDINCGSRWTEYDAVSRRGGVEPDFGEGKPKKAQQNVNINKKTKASDNTELSTITGNNLYVKKVKLSGENSYSQLKQEAKISSENKENKSNIDNNTQKIEQQIQEIKDILLDIKVNNNQKIKEIASVIKVNLPIGNQQVYDIDCPEQNENNFQLLDNDNLLDDNKDENLLQFGDKQNSNEFNQLFN